MPRRTKYFLRDIALTAILSCLMLQTALASKPLWTFVPQTPTNINIVKGSITQVIYTVHNQSSKSKNLVMKPIKGISQFAPCKLPAKGVCTLILNVNGSTLQRDVMGGPVLCQEGNDLQCYQPSATDILRVKLNLALSIKSPEADPALTGKARIIQIENTGLIPFNNVQVSTTRFPDGTSITNNTCTGTLNTGDTCDITITPGGTASPDRRANPCTTPPGTVPMPTVVTVSADDVPITKVDVLILGYGCIYEGGFLFSVDDSTSNTRSIGGKVAALTDEPNILYQWSGINNITQANSISDGLSNTLALANPPDQYPAMQTCLNKNDQGFTDWFTPAICELGRYVGYGHDAGCGTTKPNIYITLYTNGLGDFANSYYWSSTQFSDDPTEGAWYQIFSAALQDRTYKSYFYQVRCVRTFTS